MGQLGDSTTPIRGSALQIDDYNYLSDAHTTVTVNSAGGADYESIQDAVDDVPKYLEHEYIIDVQDGHDESVGGNGHVAVRGVHSLDSSEGSEGVVAAGQQNLLSIEGNRSDPSQCVIPTMSIFTTDGVSCPAVRGFEFSANAAPDTDEDWTLGVYGGGEVFIGFCDFSDGANTNYSIGVYSGQVHIRDVNFNKQWCVHAKRGAIVNISDTPLPGGPLPPYRILLDSGSMLFADTNIEAGLVTFTSFGSNDRGNVMFHEDEGIFTSSGLTRKDGKVDRRINESSDFTTSGATYYSVNSGGASVTGTLATADTVDGRVINILRKGSNPVTIVTDGTEGIYGESNDEYILDVDGETATFVYNNADNEWEVR